MIYEKLSFDDPRIPKEWESWSLTRKAPEDTSKRLTDDRADQLKRDTKNIEVSKPGSFLKVLNKVIDMTNKMDPDPTTHHQKKQQHNSLKQGLLQTLSTFYNTVTSKARKGEVTVSADEQKEIIDSAAKLDNSAPLLSQISKLFKEEYDVDYIPRDQRRKRLADIIRKVASIIHVAHCGHCGIPKEEKKKKPSK